MALEFALLHEAIFRDFSFADLGARESSRVLAAQGRTQRWQRANVEPT